MNLAFRDMRHKLGRFVVTWLGLSLLLGVVVTMAGIYRGMIADALALPVSIDADLWVVQGGTNGPFAEISRMPGATREMIARIHGIVMAGAVTFQPVQIDHAGRRLKLEVVGFEPGRPGGPVNLTAGRGITRSHYELIADRKTGFAVGDRLELGRDVYTVVGLTQGSVTASADPVVYMTLQDAQDLQFDLSPPEARRETARGAERADTDIVNAVVARISPNIPVEAVAADVRRWKHLSVLSEAEQEAILTSVVIEHARHQLGLFMGVLTVVSAVIIALIIYTLTMDKLREIATLKLIGASDRTIIGLIVQQALLMGVVGFAVGTALVWSAKDRFPRRVVLESTDLGILFGVVVVVCLLATALAVRVAVRVDPARALAG
ncbi:ABC transporter permease [Sedimenticola hydrogenitrophicus]|uniref:ABC transporter permease n=1 Tax=Sedimenticola hydrogenitrophicus TaxID=2967975 RepID=UPI0021A3C3FD|nr:ABC transporter permease [Sedimenticola hydrogenitrophicus]